MLMFYKVTGLKLETNLMFFVFQDLFSLSPPQVRVVRFYVSLISCRRWLLWHVMARITRSKVFVANPAQNLVKQLQLGHQLSLTNISLSKRLKFRRRESSSNDFESQEARLFARFRGESKLPSCQGSLLPCRVVASLLVSQKWLVVRVPP